MIIHVTKTNNKKVIVITRQSSTTGVWFVIVHAISTFCNRVTTVTKLYENNAIMITEAMYLKQRGYVPVEFIMMN